MNEDFLQPEVRDGFYVPGVMKQAWAAELTILKDIDALCLRHGIGYFAEWGTMLGAVRHRGFIPWDDDLDICMIRSDFERFREIAAKEMNGYSFLNIHTELDYEEFLNRVVNSRAISFDKEFRKKYHGCPFSVGIDVFPLDYLPRDAQEQERIRSKVLSLLDNAESSREAQNLCRLEIERVFASCREEDADELVSMPLWLQGKGSEMRKEYYQEMVRVPFEDTTIPVPVMYDSLLEKKFPNYIQPIRDWDSHGFPFYGEQETILMEHTGQAYGKYLFRKEDLNRPKVRKPEGLRGLRECVKRHLAIWEIILDKEDELLREGQTQSFLQLLAKVQEMAIGLGNELEQSGKGRGVEETVHSIEDFCEDLYSYFGKVKEGQASDGESLRASMMKIGAAAARSLPKEEAIAFFYSRMDEWKALEPYYRREVQLAEEQENSAEILVVPVPYYKKDLDGKPDAEFWEADPPDEGISVTDYRA
nr:LicD family protein [Eubacterium sp.]